MLQLQVDFGLLNKIFDIPYSRIVQYADKDFKEIMELEAQQGNKKAEDYEEILSNPDKILEIFKLANVENKLLILQNMSEGDLDNLLPYLKHEQLTVGLNFFTEEKLLKMCEELPKDVLVAMVFEKFDTVDVLSMMDESAMNKILSEPDVERNHAQKYFESLDQKTLEMIMIQAYGYEYKGKEKDEYTEKLSDLSNDKFKSFMYSLEKKSKIGLINGLVEQDEDLLLLFKSEDLLAPMELLMKDDKIKLMSTLDDEFLIPMIQELPIDLTQIVLTQIDPKEFSEILSEDFKDILASAVLFSGSKS